MVRLETNTIITYIACICFLFILGKIFIIPLKHIAKVVLNSILGGLLIGLINLIGGFFQFHIGINIITSIIIGILGIPGAILLVVIKIILGG